MRIGDAIAFGIGLTWIFICGFVIGNSRPQPHNAYEERAATTATRDVAAQPSVVIQTFGYPDERGAATNPKQSKADKLLDKLLDPIVYLTLAIAAFAFWQVQIYRAMRDHTTIVERAYVDLSHAQPGVTFHINNVPLSGPPTFDVRVTVSAVNSGSTPADVIASEIDLRIGDQPLMPNPVRPALPQNLDPIFTLMPRDRSHFWRNWPMPTQTDLDRLRYMAIALHVIGWILYRDKFGKLHRSGYARRYLFNQDLTVNNLIFVEAPGYNYEEDLD